MEEEIKNGNLNAAKKNKNDEFYTQRSDIENEMKHYKAHFKGKTVFCNCDDPEWSNFWFYFSQNFNHLGLKRLISTHYREGGQSYMLEMDSSRLPLERFRKVDLQGDGDFRSDECIELLKQSDIVVTNPPFSLFREYICQLSEYGKKFLIIGNKNSITYKETFTLIKSGKLWIGHRNINSDMWFELPDDAEKFEKILNGKKQSHIMGCWLTNLDHRRRKERLELYMRFSENPDYYPKYDNYDAIEVSKVREIPEDYYGAMGVPITFLDKFNPDQFEIIGSFNAGSHGEELGARASEIILSSGKVSLWNGPIVQRKPLYKRIIIRRKP